MPFPLESASPASLGFDPKALARLREMITRHVASPRTFGHGRVGSSYGWGDPDSGASFAYLTNSRLPDPRHAQWLELVSNLVHTAIA